MAEPTDLTPQGVAASSGHTSASVTAEETALGLSTALAEQQVAHEHLGAAQAELRAIPDQGSAQGAAQGVSLDAPFQDAAAELERLSLQVLLAWCSV